MIHIGWKLVSWGLTLDAENQQASIPLTIKTEKPNFDVLGLRTDKHDKVNIFCRGGCFKFVCLFGDLIFLRITWIESQSTTLGEIVALIIICSRGFLFLIITSVHVNLNVWTNVYLNCIITFASSTNIWHSVY